MNIEYILRWRRHCDKPIFSSSRYQEKRVFFAGILLEWRGPIDPLRMTIRELLIFCSDFFFNLVLICP